MALVRKSCNDFLQVAIDNLSMQADIHHAFKKMNKWDAIRYLYGKVKPSILRRGNGYGINPYIIDWTSYFTPIELDAWQTIRSVGIPLYPQFPVGNYFVDFGDPIRRIALECDGKDYHSKATDLQRDARLMESGWIVFRVTGSECHKTLQYIGELAYEHECGLISDDDFDNKLKNWSLNTSEGVINAIAWRFYKPRLSVEQSKYLDEALSKHSFFYSESQHG